MIPLTMTRYEKYKLTVHQVKKRLEQFHFGEHGMTLGGYAIHFEYYDNEKAYILFINNYYIPLDSPLNEFDILTLNEDDFYLLMTQLDMGMLK